MTLYQSPIDRLIDSGVAVLSDAELLALLLPTPTTAATLLLANQVLTQTDGWSGLRQCAYAELLTLGVPDSSSAARILAALALPSRCARADMSIRPVINAPADVAELLMAELRHLPQEELHVVILNSKNHVLQIEMVGRGTVNAVHVRVCEVLRTAVRMNASAVILAHNHPSGVCDPSPEDIALTTRVRQAGELLGVDILDHLIIGAGRWLSLRECCRWGALPAWDARAEEPV